MVVSTCYLPVCLHYYYHH